MQILARFLIKPLAFGFTTAMTYKFETRAGRYGRARTFSRFISIIMLYEIKSFGLSYQYKCVIASLGQTRAARV